MVLHAKVYGCQYVGSEVKASQGTIQHIRRSSGSYSKRQEGNIFWRVLWTMSSLLYDALRYLPYFGDKSTEIPRELLPVSPRFVFTQCCYPTVPNFESE
jgi:hypothetical protein